MSAINPERGEVAILLDGKPYPMRPSYEAIIAIESQLGPILALLTRLAHPLQRLKVTELSVIVAETIRAAGKERDDPVLQAVTAEKVGRLLFDQGLARVIDQVEPLLVNMIAGGAEPQKKSGDESAPT